MYSILFHGEGLFQTILLFAAIFFILQFVFVIVVAFSFRRYLRHREEKKQNLA